MKNLIAILTVIFFIFSIFCYAQNSNIKKTDIQELGLFGKVKQFKQDKYVAKDKFGEIIQGQRVTDLSLQNLVLLKFDNEGNIVERNEYNIDGSLSNKYIVKCESKENTIEKSLYYPNGSLLGKFIIKFDSHRNIVETDAYQPDGKIVVRSNFKYDENSNQIEKISEQFDDGFKQRTYNKYDIKGNIIDSKTESYQKNDSRGWFCISHETKKYDDKGNNIEIVILNCVNGAMIRKTIQKFDDKGSIIEENNYNVDGGLMYKYIYKFDYDKKGNWIKKIDFENEIPAYITIRQIEYYTE